MFAFPFVAKKQAPRTSRTQQKIETASRELCIAHPGEKSTPVHTRLLRCEGMDSTRAMFRTFDFIVVTDGYWHSTPRIRHKMPLAWAAAGHRVLWCERSPFPQSWTQGRLVRAFSSQLEPVQERLWVLPTPPALPRLERRSFPGPLLRSIHGPWLASRVRRATLELGLRDPVLVLMQHGARGDLLDLIPHRLSVYYTHDLFGYGTISEQDRSMEDDLCGRVDWVWTTSEHRASTLAPHARRIRCLPHAVDLEWWGRNVTNPQPAAVASIPKPRLVFTGAVDFRIDWQLLRALAAAEPTWQVVLCGPVSHESIEQVKSLPPNIHAVGNLPLDSLPSVIDGADVLLLPYRPDPMTESIGRPLKFYDYLASGRPIVSTRFADFGPNSEQLISFSADALGWQAVIADALANPNPEQATRRREEASRNSYAARLHEQEEMLASVNESKPEE